MINNNEFYIAFNASQTKAVIDILNEYSKALLSGEYSTEKDAKACKAIALVNEIESQFWQYIKNGYNAVIDKG